MLGRDYDTQVCSISRSLEVVGERWTILILRDVLIGRRRFDELIESLGVTRTVLGNRLRLLVDHGVLERRLYQRRPDRYEYYLTAKGADLLPVVAHLMWWGDRYYPEPEGPPRLILHRGCGGTVDRYFSCERCGARLGIDDFATEPGPGAKEKAATTSP